MNGCYRLKLMTAYQSYGCFFRDLGIHIDGYVAVIGHTLVVGASKVLISAIFWGVRLLAIVKKSVLHHYVPFSQFNLTKITYCNISGVTFSLPTYLVRPLSSPVTLF